MNISACCFIKDTIDGAFCLWESMATLLAMPQVTEYIILDLGSTDGTYQLLQEIAAINPKIKVRSGNWPSIDAGAFAKLANDLVAMCSNDVVWYHQADEIWHENLLAITNKKLMEGQIDLAFWRIQYANNFQYVKWFPHLVHRIGLRSNRILLNEGKLNFEFVGDGMNTSRMWDAKICSNYGGEMFPKWGSLGDDGIKPYVNEMVLDVSMIGGFRDNIVERKTKHAPFWRDGMNIPYHIYYGNNKREQVQLPVEQWQQRAANDPDWTKTETPFDIPHIMRYHVGKTRYEVRRDLIEAIKAGVGYYFIERI